MKHLYVSFVICLIAAPAHGGMRYCSSRDDLLDTLGGPKYQEKTRGLGIDNGGGLTELLVSPDGATWTIIRTLPSGLSCIEATGEDWRDEPKPPEGQRS